MVLFRRYLSTLFLLLPLFCVGPAQAELTIRITQGEARGLPIAIVPFGTQVPVPEDVAGIITADLASSGRFAPLESTRFPGMPQTLDGVDFAQWRAAGAESLVIGQVLGTATGYNIEFRVLDVVSGQQILAFAAPANDRNLRLTAHRIADLIFEKLTGLKGAFATRIAYVLVQETAKGKRFTLQLADSDGANTVTLLSSPEPVLSPAWSPDGTRIAYASFEGRRSRVYIQELATGARRVVSAEEGINGAPAFSPDGSRLALTLSRDGDPEIYILSLTTGEYQRITRNPAIDTEAQWSADGRSLFFTSDRGGSPQIYRVAATGGEAQRITFEQGNYNARPVPSPDGSRLAMVTRVEGAYRIGLLELGGRRDFTVLSTAGLDESPTFAPNGQILMYATRGRGGSELATVSVDGRVRQRLNVPDGQVREPAWGPFLQ